MKRQTAREVRATTKPEIPKLIEPESQFAKLRELEEAIARRAFELFEGRGCDHGRDLARKREADLVVVGAQGRGGISRFLHGSVSEAVAIHAHCSVEVIDDRAHFSEGETA